jgi:hypothetical protein
MTKKVIVRRSICRIFRDRIGDESQTFDGSITCWHQQSTCAAQLCDARSDKPWGIVTAATRLASQVSRNLPHRTDLIKGFDPESVVTNCEPKLPTRRRIIFR